MDFISASITILTSLILCTYFYILLSKSLNRRRLVNLPPGPPPLPIVGNIHQLGPNPHDTLTKLSKTYGPIMYLKFGRVNTIVISSPEIAKLVLKTHDHTLASRPVPTTLQVFGHENVSVAWLSANSPRWRLLRRVCKDFMFSSQTLDSCHGLRQEKMRELQDYVQECSETGQAVSISEAAFIASLNMLSASMFSIDFASFKSNSSAQEFREAVHGLLRVHGTPNITDYFPVLKVLDPQGLLRESSFYAKKLMQKFDEIISQRTLELTSSGDVLQKLVDFSLANEAEFDRNSILHLLVDLFLAGTDTTATTVEWAMSELIRHPKKMERARDELITLRKKGKLEESEIAKLSYMQAILKETFRLHPSGPLMLPHMADGDTEIAGYMIPANTQILVNIYAIGRDESIWPNPSSFEPERFLDSNIDTKGHDFELIPFGSGRRICPAMPLANRVVPLMIASLILDFDWRVQEHHVMDMNDKFGLTLHKAIPLEGFPVKVSHY